MKKELVEMLHLACELFDLIDSKTGIMRKSGADGELSKVLKYELVSFLMCLSASDGRISRVEAKLIRDYFGLELYPIDIKESISENNIGTSEYFEKVPECLKIAIMVDNFIVGNNVGIKQSIGELIIELFKAFGKEMVVADEKVKAEEQVAWRTYIQMMTLFMTDNSTLFKIMPGDNPRPGMPIEVDYEMSLDKVGRIYTLYIGKFD